MKILVLTDDRIGRCMAGSGLRAWELARALFAAGHEVRVAAAAGSVQPDGHGPEVGTSPPWRWPEAILSAPWNLPPRAFLGDRLLVADCVTPLLAELSAMPPQSSVLRRRRNAAARIPLVASRADAVLVAGKTQKTWWSRRLRPDIPILEVPFGIPDEDPTAEYDQIANVPRDWTIVLWWGGVWPWLDLETLIAARTRLGSKKISIVVPTAQRPGSSNEQFTFENLRSLSERYNLHPPQVMPLEDWVPYADRHRVLNRCSLLAVLHQPGPETDLSFRTRALDGVWAGIPMLLSEGGEVARLARQNGWGGVVNPGDAVTTAAAMDILLTDREQLRVRNSIEASRETWRWSKVTEPLVELLTLLPTVSRGGLAPATAKAVISLIRFSEGIDR